MGWEKSKNIPEIPRTTNYETESKKLAQILKIKLTSFTFYFLTFNKYLNCTY